MKFAKAVPILYYHRINEVDGPSFAVRPSVFEKQMSALVRAGWKTIRLGELSEFVSGRKKLPERSMMITFDDAYLDNWVFAHPILARFGMNAVVFPITDRITNGEVRPRSDEMQESSLPEILNCRIANLTYLSDEAAKRKAFLTWEELKAMEAGGVWEIGAHTHHHGEHYISNKVEGIITSAEPHWTRGLPTKGDMRPGMPYFKKASDMMGLGYYDDPKLRDEMVKHLTDLGGLRYFKTGKYIKKRKLVETARGLVRTKYPGRWETQEERSSRLRAELSLSCGILEKELGHAVENICWPFGECDSVSIKAAQDAGFKLAFTVRRGPVQPGDNPMRLHRIKILELSPQKLLTTLDLYSRPIIGKIMGSLSGTGKDK